MERGIQCIEDLTSEGGTLDIKEIIRRYSEYYPEETDWKLLTHLQRQAMVYANIIEQVKAGRTASDIRQQFEDLELVPKGILPNPHGMLEFAFRKLDKLLQAMVDFVKQRGKEFIAKLSLEFGLSVGIGLELGFPPSISLNVEKTTTVGFDAEKRS